MSTTITRKQYSGLDVDSTWTETGNTGTILGLDYKEVQKEFDGSVSEGGLSIDDAFDVDEINVDDSHSTGIASLVGKIATVQNQERCIPTGLDGAPVVSGYAVTTQSSDTEDALVADLTTTKEATLEEATLTDDVKNSLVSALKAQGFACNDLKVWKASGKVSLNLVSGSVLIDGRKNMFDYSLDDCNKEAWFQLPWSIVKTLPVDALTSIFTDVQLAYGEKWNNAFLTGEATTGLSVDENGIISGTPNGYNRICFIPNGTTETRLFCNCDIDGNLSILTYKNTRIILSVLAITSRLSMDNILGIAGAFKGIEDIGNWIGPIVSAGFPKIIGIYEKNPTIKEYIQGNKLPDNDYPIKVVSKINTGYVMSNDTSFKVWWHCNGWQSGYLSVMSASSFGTSGCLQLQYNSNDKLMTVHSTNTVLYTAVNSLTNKDIVSYISRTRQSQNVGGVEYSSSNTLSYSGYEMVFGAANSEQQIKCFQIFESDVEKIRMFALDENVWWDILNNKLYDMRS